MDPTAQHREPTPLDRGDLIARCLGNIEFVERVLAKFQQHFGEDLEELERALPGGDAETIGRIAHRLKGASANVAARGLQARSAAIEDLSRWRRIAEIPPCVEDLRDEWSRFQESAASIAVAPGEPA